MNEHESYEVKMAYDRLADRYDSLMGTSGIYRRELWKLYRKTFHTGQHIIDLGCGTGTDSLFLAGMGCRVTALDISSNMLNRLRDKLSREELTRWITIVQADMNDLSGMPLDEADGVVSGFAAVNTVTNMKLLAGTLQSLVRRNGDVILHGLNAVKPLPDSHLENGMDGDIKTRKIRIGNIEVPHFLMTPEYLYDNYFKEGFELAEVFGMGRYYSFYENPGYPQWLRQTVNRLEVIVTSKRTMIEKGRFFVIRMKKR